MKEESTTSKAVTLAGVFGLAILVAGALGYALGASRTARIKDDHSIELTLVFTAKLKAQDERIAQLQQELKDKPRALKEYSIEAIKQLASWLTIESVSSPSSKATCLTRNSERRTLLVRWIDTSETTKISRSRLCEA